MDISVNEAWQPRSGGRWVWCPYGTRAGEIRPAFDVGAWLGIRYGVLNRPDQRAVFDQGTPESNQADAAEYVMAAAGARHRSGG